MKKTLAVLAFFFCSVPAFAQLVSQGQERVVTYSGASVTLSSNTNASQFFQTTGQNTFILGVNPNTVARLYLSNETANACSTVTVSMASTPNQFTSSFNLRPQVWNPVFVLSTGGVFASSATVTIPANGTVIVTSQTILGSQLAVFIVVTPGTCATTNFDAVVSFGIQVSNPVSVSGGIAVGPGAQTGSPVNFVMLAPGVGSAAQFGLSIGQPVSGAQHGFTGEVTPNGQAAGGLAVNLHAMQGFGGNSATLSSTTTDCNGTGTNCSGLNVSDVGMNAHLINPTAITTNSTQTVGTVGNNVNSVGSEVQSCRVDFIVSAASGTTPTLDVYLQDSPNGTNFTDRIHFAQFTTTGSVWATLTYAAATATPTVYTDATLAANTIVNGALTGQFRFKYVVTGTTPSFTVQWFLNCK